MRGVYLSTAAWLYLDCLSSGPCGEDIPRRPAPVNHPDLGILHVNSLVHPDIDDIHRDEYDSRMDRIPPVYHHSDQGMISCIMMLYLQGFDILSILMILLYLRLLL